MSLNFKKYQFKITIFENFAMQPFRQNSLLNQTVDA